ncbi:MAG: AAA family ATPase [bacterium]
MDRPLVINPVSQPQTEARVTLFCLGSASVARIAADASVEILFGPGKPLAVVTALLLAPSRTASRERIIDLLWGNHDLAYGRKQLRNALHYLRSSIGQWVIDADKQTCTLSPALTADVLDFRAAIERDDLEAALAIYRGDFLPDFASPDCGEFELWAEKQRAYFRSFAAGAAETVSRRALDTGQFRKARDFAVRLREIDSGSELAWRVGLEAAVASGDSRVIAAEATLFEQWLGHEEREPDTASKAILRAARSADDASASETSRNALVTELVGREHEFKAILDAWSRARAGRPQAVYLTGPAGLGKTRLLKDVEGRLRSERARTVSVRGHIGERAVPYAFIVTLVHELARLRGAKTVSESVAATLVSIDPRLSQHFSVAADHAPAHDVPNRRSIAVRELLSAVSSEAPLALLLDDVHWLDENRGPSWPQRFPATSATTFCSPWRREPRLWALSATRSRPRSPCGRSTRMRSASWSHSLARCRRRWNGRYRWFVD